MTLNKLDQFGLTNYTHKPATFIADGKYVPSKAMSPSHVVEAMNSNGAVREFSYMPQKSARQTIIDVYNERQRQVLEQVVKNKGLRR